MFSIKEKQHIAQVVEDTIRGFNHPEMDNSKIEFSLHVDGKEKWSFADITPNHHFHPENQNPWNEVARDILKP